MGLIKQKLQIDGIKKIILKLGFDNYWLKKL